MRLHQCPTSFISWHSFTLDQNTFHRATYTLCYIRSKPSISSSDSSPEPKSSYSESDILNWKFSLKQYKNIYLALKNKYRNVLCASFARIHSHLFYRVSKLFYVGIFVRAEKWVNQKSKFDSTLNLIRHSTPRILIRLIRRPIVQYRRPILVGTLWLIHCPNQTAA